MRVCSFDRLEFEENQTNGQTSNEQTILNAEGQNRTVDTRIFSPLLYQLSYLGKYDKKPVFFLLHPQSVPLQVYIGIGYE